MKHLSILLETSNLKERLPPTLPLLGIVPTMYYVYVLYRHQSVLLKSNITELEYEKQLVFSLKESKEWLLVLQIFGVGKKSLVLKHF